MSKQHNTLEEFTSKRISPERAERIAQRADELLLEMTLKELRKEIGMTQGQLAEATGVTQPQLSRLEKRSDHVVSTVKRYVEALGGRLELVAVIDDKRVKLTI